MGKHEGEYVQDIAYTDRQYVEYLLDLDWFPAQHPNLFRYFYHEIHGTPAPDPFQM